jgi:TnpA family transposase
VRGNQKKQEKQTIFFGEGGLIKLNQIEQRIIYNKNLTNERKDNFNTQLLVFVLEKKPWGWGEGEGEGS